MGDVQWSTLPDPVVIKIMSFLSPKDLCRAGSTCHTWFTCSLAPSLWQRMTFIFSETLDGRQLKWLEHHVDHIKYLSIVLDQQNPNNRDNACNVLKTVASVEGRDLMSVNIKFIGENPLFYAGKDFVDALKVLFSPEVVTKPSSLRDVDLSGLSVAFDETLIDALSEHNSELESLNVVNNMIICKVPPASVLRLVDRCKKLTVLKLHYSSVSDDALRHLAQPDRAPLKHLTLMCRREQKFSVELDSEAWRELVKRCPDLRVSLAFDHTCPLDRVRPIMDPAMPVHDLYLETFTHLEAEIDQATSFYFKTLETLVLQTRNSPELGSSLINLCSRCSRLSTLLVYCVLDKEVVEKVLQLCPIMKEKKTYILKWEMEPEPWVVGVEEGD